MSVPYDRLKKDARAFVFTALALTIIGLIFIYSSSSIFALEKKGMAHYFLLKQLIYLIPSAMGFFLFALVPLETWRKYASRLFLGSLALTLLTFLPHLGHKVHAASRWIIIAGVSIQPSEFLKLFFFIYVGYFLERRLDHLKSFLYTYLPLGVVAGITFLLLLKQPDFGSVALLFATLLMVFFVAECNMRYLVWTAVGALPIITALIITKSYRLNRILVFLNPWADPLGKGFQIVQSLIAIGSGSWWGEGISNSRQKFFYLPMQHTDFIFPIIAEEIGFIGSCALIVLYIVFCFFGLRLCLNFSNYFAFFTGLSFVLFISLQAIMNLMVATALIPTKGVGLPFISYGGTALMCMWCMIGLIVNAAREGRMKS